MKQLHLSTVPLGVALVLLTACGDSEEDPNGNGTQSPEPTATQTDNGTDDPDDNDVDPTPDEDPQGVPDLAEIWDDIWDSSLDQESVTITTELSASALGADEFEDNGDPDDTVEVVITGNLAGEGAIFQQPDAEFLLIGEEIFQTVDDFVAVFANSAPEGVELEIDPDELHATLSGVGQWVEVTSDYAASVQTAQEFLEDVRSGFGDIEQEVTGAEEEGDDGEPVWVYSISGEDTDVEVVVAADAEQPLLNSIDGTDQEETLTVSFQDWNEAEVPERPDDELIIDEVQFQELVQPLL